MQERRSLVAYTRLEHSVPVVPSDGTLDCFGKVGFLSKGIDIDGVKPVTTVHKTLNLVGLICVGFGCQIPGISCRINNSSGLCARDVSAEPAITVQDSP